MFKKVLTLIISAFFIVCLLSGCVETRFSVKINDEGGDFALNVLIEKAVYEMMSENGSIEGLEMMSDDGIVIEDGTEYMSLIYKQSFTTYAELEAALLDMSFLSVNEEVGVSAEFNVPFDFDTATAQSEEGVEITYDPNGSIERDYDSDNYSSSGNLSEDYATNAADGIESAVQGMDVSSLFQTVQILREETDDAIVYTFSAVTVVQEANSGGVDGYSGDETNESVNFDAALNSAIKYKFEIVLPADIIDSSGGSVDGNKLVCDISDLTVEKEIYAKAALFKDADTEEERGEEVFIPGNNVYPNADSNEAIEASVTTNDTLLWSILAVVLGFLLFFCIITIILLFRARLHNKK